MKLGNKALMSGLGFSVLLNVALCICYVSKSLKVKKLKEESVILEEKKAQLDKLIKETDGVLARLKQEVSEMQKRK